MVIQIIVILFLLFALSRVFLRFRDHSITIIEFMLWSCLWIAIGVVVLLPNTTQWLAKILGVGRGVDAMLYISIIFLFYGLFRLYVKMEYIEHEITSIVRKIALQNRRK